MRESTSSQEASEPECVLSVSRVSILISQFSADRQHIHASARGLISDAGAAKLITMAYFASQIPEEGRYLRFRLFVPARRNLPPELARQWVLVEFENQRRINDSDDMRRFAPIAADHRMSRQIAETSTSQLVAIGNGIGRGSRS